MAGLLFFSPAVGLAQAPVITNPGNLRAVDVNTAIHPLDPNPEWNAMAPMPTARTGFATAAAGGKLYAIGGGILNICDTIDTVEAYEPPPKDLWTTGLAPLPAPHRWRPAGTALDGIIYVVGGQSTENGCPGQALNTVQAYDPATDNWSDKSPLNQARLQVGLGIDPVNHLLYAVGGAEPDYTALDTVEVFDPATDSWTTKEHLNTPRGFPAVVAVNGKIYAIGGQKEDHGAIDSVEEFDPNANGGFGAWTTKPSVMPHPRLHSAAAVVENKVYVIGGEATGRGLIPTVDVYDPTSDVWTTESPMPTARRVLGAATIGDTIYGVGGEALVATVGEKFTYQITATNNPTEYDAFPLPEGLSIDRARGIIFGVPKQPTTAFVMTFEATNESGSGSKDVSLFIAPRPEPLPELGTILGGTCVTGRAGQPFAFQVLTDNASSDAELAATGLPYKPGVGPQMALDRGTGLISGMIPQSSDGSAQSFGVQLGLSDAVSAQSYLQLTFVSDQALPVITSGANTVLVLNQFFSYTIATDTPANSFAYLGLDGKLDGTLPPGLSFDASTGTISGIYSGETLLSSRSVREQPERRTNRDSIRNGIDTIETIKKEPPPRIQLFATEEPDGTGTTPLDFIIGLHDFEAEVLSSKTSDKTDYVIFTDDPLASGIGAGLLKAISIGDYVTYTVPVAKSGSYDVKVGIRTGESQSIFQLAIDDVNQGAPQDGYSPTIAYEIRDVGPVTFESAGDREFRFSIVGQNPNSSGRNFVCDYIDLVPHFEAEGLAVQENSAPYTTVRDPKLSGGSGTLFKATRVGDYLTYTVPIANAGIYNIRLKTEPTGTAASCQLFIDGARQGYPQQGNGDGSGLLDLGSAKFNSAGDKAFKFQIAERGRKGLGYKFLFDDLELVLATHLEAEALAVRANGSFKRIEDETLSGQAGVLFNPDAAGSSVAYKVTIPVAGTYDVKVGIRTGKRSGIVQLSIDDVDQGTANDAYSAGVGYEVLDLGRVTFTEAGEKTFRFEVTGQNSKSKGLEFLLDYFDLLR